MINTHSNVLSPLLAVARNLQPLYNFETRFFIISHIKCEYSHQVNFNLKKKKNRSFLLFAVTIFHSNQKPCFSGMGCLCFFFKFEYVQICYNQKGSESYLVNTKAYKAKFSVADISVNAKKHHGMIYAVK